MSIGFQAELQRHGLEPGTIISDGMIHRFSTNGKKADKSGWYIHYMDEMEVGLFGDWRSIDTQKWCSKDKTVWNSNDANLFKEKIEQAKKTREYESQKLAEQCRAKSADIWSQAVPPNGHGYLKSKQIKAFCAKEMNTELIIPVYDIVGTLQSIQKIKPDGKRKFEFGGKIKGNFAYVGQFPAKRMLLCEGFSTAASIHEATGHTVIICFNAANMPEVAKLLKNKFPKNQMDVCGDDDMQNQINAGRKYADEAAAILGVIPVYPTFENYDDSPTDFNDLHVREGLKIVAKQIMGGIQKIFSLSPATAQVCNWLREKPPEREYLLYHQHEGILPKNILGALSAGGGTGKSVFALQLALYLAGGPKLAPFEKKQDCNVLVLAFEDQQEEMGRRLWNMSDGGNFPPGLYAQSMLGGAGALMELIEQTPTPSYWYHWLRESLKDFQDLDLIIIDPLSRAYGLEENKNEHATAFVEAMERIVKDFKVSILMTNHINKSAADAGALKATMSRGASALYDGCRWGSGMVPMSEAEGQEHSIENHNDFIQWGITKTNYGKPLTGLYFEKKPLDGTIKFEYANIRQNTNEAMADALVAIIGHSDKSYSKTDLQKTTAITKFFIQKLKAEGFETATQKKLFSALNLALRNGWLVENMIQTGGREKHVLTAI